MIDIKDIIYQMKMIDIKNRMYRIYSMYRINQQNIQNRMVDTKGRIYKNNGKTYKIKWQIVKVEYTK